jgi:uncharacterized protein
MRRLRPTLLVFTLGPTAEGQRKALLPRGGQSLASDLFAACLEGALEAGRACAMDLRLAAPGAAPAGFAAAPDVTVVRQRGSGFGERFRGVVQAAFAETAAPVVVVGTDSPGLGSEAIARALCLLADNPEQVVIGPAKDGGFYLLAAARPLDEALKQTRFCRPDTLAVLRASLQAMGRPVVLLQPLADLDGPADLRRLVANAGALTIAWRQLVAGVERLLRALSRPLEPSLLGSPRPTLVRVRAGRAPPQR